MILIDVYNQAIVELLTRRFEAAKEDPTFEAKLEYTVADFDGVTYAVSSGSDAGARKLTVSIFLAFFNELEQHGVTEFLRKEYGDLLSATPLKGQSVTLNLDLNALPEDHVALAKKCAMLKRHCMAAVFSKFFDLQPTLAANSKGERAVIHYRSDETMYIQAMHDRVTVIFSIMFKDPDDMLIGKVFMQEFQESRRRLDRAPQVLYSHRNPPSELQGTNAAVNDSLAYVTFVMQPRHVARGPCRQKAIDLLHTMRTYLHYHIKCSKAYIQMRMRAKTGEFLKIVNRAAVSESSNAVVNTMETTPSTAKLVGTALSAMGRTS